MTDYTTKELNDLLNEKGELLVVLDSDGYDGPVELHRHDTIIGHGRVNLSLSDGATEFPVSAVESATWHLQSTDDLGL